MHLYTGTTIYRLFKTYLRKEKWARNILVLVMTHISCQKVKKRNMKPQRLPFLQCSGSVSFWSRIR